MTILDELYASGGTEISLPCLSFRCSAWESIHLCQGFTDTTAALETAEVVTFTATDFVAQLPARGENGLQNVQFTIGATLDVLNKIDAAIENYNKVYVDYREYLLSDLTAPAKPVQTMVVTPYTFNSDTNQISFVAGFNDLVNKAWPRTRYTTKITPGLKYYGS